MTADRKHHTRYACRDSVVQLKGTPAKMVICVRTYKRFEFRHSDVMGSGRYFYASPPRDASVTG